MIEESLKFASQNPLQTYKVPNRHKFSGELLDKANESTEKLVAPILAVAKNMEQLWHQLDGVIRVVGRF